jgi:hypothetical protein
MKIPLTASLAVVLLFLAACEQKSAQVTTASSPSSMPTPASETPDYSAISPASSVESSSQEQAAGPAPSMSPASSGRPVFKNEVATKVANDYLDKYQTFLNDMNAQAPPAIPDMQTAVNNANNALQKIAQDSVELANQERQVQRELTQDERRRLRQYQTSLERGGQAADQGQ